MSETRAAMTSDIFFISGQEVAARIFCQDLGIDQKRLCVLEHNATRGRSVPVVIVIAGHPKAPTLRDEALIVSCGAIVMTCDDYAVRRASQQPRARSGDGDEPSIGITRKFRLGDRVEKTKGSSWRGRVVGFYSTALTPFGYCVESEREPGSVQIYPESALALVEVGR